MYCDHYLTICNYVYDKKNSKCIDDHRINISVSSQQTRVISYQLRDGKSTFNSDVLFIYQSNFCRPKYWKSVAFLRFSSLLFVFFSHKLVAVE